jgi:hypothetical protein
LLAVNKHATCSCGSPRDSLKCIIVFRVVEKPKTSHWLFQEKIYEIVEIEQLKPGDEYCDMCGPGSKRESFPGFRLLRGGVLGNLINSRRSKCFWFFMVQK